VNALQAGRILVSDLQGGSITGENVECRSGNFVVRGIELPAEFLQELIDKARPETTIMQQMPQSELQAQQYEENSKNPTTECEPTVNEKSEQKAPERPPPPREFYPSDYAPYSIPPPAFYQLRNGDSNEELRDIHAATAPAQRKSRRHHRRRESTSEEEYQRNRRSQCDAHSPQMTIMDLSSQLIRACGTSVLATLHNASRAIMNLLHGATHGNDDKRKDLNLVLIILIIIIAGLMMLGMSGDHSVHHHHWDYYNPPDNTGRL